MRLDGIDHVALKCASPAESMAWYIRVLGFEHVFAGEWESVPIVLRLGSTCLALFPSHGDNRELAAIRIDHLAFRAATYADFNAAQRELQAHAIPFQFQDHQVSHSIYFADPDGHKLEITTYALENVRGPRST